jgi:hypothetical protein
MNGGTKWARLYIRYLPTNHISPEMTYNFEYNKLTLNAICVVVAEMCTVKSPILPQNGMEKLRRGVD